MLLSLVLGAIGGIGWGLLHPAEKVQYYSGDKAAVLQESLGASFTGVVWFSSIAAIIGLVIGLGAFRLYPRMRSLSMEYWVGISAALAAVVMVICGQMVGSFRQPDTSTLVQGQIVEIIPRFNTYAALLISPLVAMISYWAGLLATESGE